MGKAMKVMKKKAAMKAMKAMKVMKKKAAMKRRAMKAAAVAPAMKVMRKKAAMKAMKVMKKKAVATMTAGAITVAVAEKTGLKAKEVKGVFSALSAIGVSECKKT